MPAKKVETPDLDLDAIAAAQREVVLTFKLADRLWHVRSGLDLPWDTLESMLGEAEEGGSLVLQMSNFNDFFRLVLVPEEAEDFVTLGAKGLTPRQAPDLMRAIAPKLFSTRKRPTRKPSVSTAGRRPTGRSRAAASSGRVTPRSRSRS